MPFELVSEFIVVNPYPRQEYRDKTVSFVHAGLVPNATVIVEEEFDEDSEEL
jgi:hypothetical protein